jgi:AcrR family transcriptional regulator
VTTPPTSRSRAKADRRRALLSAAAKLYAERGFERVSLEELGAAVGISGPAVYRHFPAKQAVLASLLVEVSQGLLDSGRSVLAGSADPTRNLRDLIAFHVDFALQHPDVIRVQTRELESLDDADRQLVRTLQRRYVDLWIGVLAVLHPDDVLSESRARAHAVFGLINSTPHSARRTRNTRRILERMAEAALLA